jgi:hypothetical protein
MVLSDRFSRLAFCANGSQASDLTAFLRALFLAGDHAFGLDSHDIESFEAAWSISDTIVSSHRWVAALADESMSSANSTTAAAGSPRSSRRRISDKCLLFIGSWRKATGVKRERKVSGLRRAE